MIRKAFNEAVSNCCLYSVGKGREFDDLNVVLKKMEHWAHRLYPKLPFDDVMDRVAFLGKKQSIRAFLRYKKRLPFVVSSA